MGKTALVKTVGVLTVAAMVLTSCGATDEDRDGDPGVVVARHHRIVARIPDYDLTILRSSDGTAYEKDVSRAAFDHCFRGSGYPACVDR